MGEEYYSQYEEAFQIDNSLKAEECCKKTRAVWKRNLPLFEKQSLFPNYTTTMPYVDESLLYMSGSILTCFYRKGNSYEIAERFVMDSLLSLFIFLFIWRS
jgi:hypothetical protein